MRTRLRRRAGVVLGVTLLPTGGGVAVASWTATGTGQGSREPRPSPGSS